MQKEKNVGSLLVYDDAVNYKGITADLFCGILYILGSIVALCGHTIDSGKFYVEEHCFSGLPYQTAPNLDQCLSNGEDR